MNIVSQLFHEVDSSINYTDMCLYPGQQYCFYLNIIGYFNDDRSTLVTVKPLFLKSLFYQGEEGGGALSLELYKIRFSRISGQ